MTKLEEIVHFLALPLVLLSSAALRYMTYSVTGVLMTLRTIDEFSAKGHFLLMQ